MQNDVTAPTAASQSTAQTAAAPSPSKRITVLDGAKGLAILYVPFYHICFTAEPYMYVGEVGGCLLLGFFFLVSGYGYDPNKRPFGQQILYRLRTLILPTFCWLAATCLVMCVFYATVEGESAEYLVQSILLTIFRPELLSAVNPGCETFTNMFNTMSPVWFVWTLFWADVLLYTVGKFALKNRTNLAITCLLMLAASAAMLQADLHLPWNLQCVPFYSALITIGAAISLYRRDHAGRLASNPSWGRTRWIIIVAAAIGCFAISYVAPTCKLFMGGLGTLGGINAFTFFVGAILFTLVFVEVLGRAFNHVEALRKPLTWLGRNTLPILIIHGPIGVMVAHLINVPAKLEVLIWSMDSFPWSELGGMPIHMGSLAVYLITVALSIAVIIAYKKVKGGLKK